MSRYVFISNEGSTFSPNCEGAMPDVENQQVLGYEEGRTPESAFKKLIKNNKWITDKGFGEVKAMEVSKETSYFIVGEEK